MRSRSPGGYRHARVLTAEDEVDLPGLAIRWKIRDLF
jgi:hypothetical protein